MAKFERYEPRSDSQPVFDGGELEDEDEEGSRLPLLLVIGLLVVAAFAGVVWLAYTQGVQRGRADAPRMLVAASGPVKEAPANPGGVQTPFKDLKIYQQPAPPQDEDTDSAPQPPTPKAPAPSSDAQVLPVVIAPTAADARVAQNAAQTKASDATPSTIIPNIESGAPPTSDADAQTKPKPAPAHKAAAAPRPFEPPAVVAENDAPVHTGGSAALQIGAYKSEAEANAAWNAFQSKHPIAGGYQSEIKKVDLGDKGIWYRLRLGTFADKTAAMTFCDKLKADGGTCFLAK